MSDRRLHLLNYTDLTMAAADPEVQLPMRLGEQWFVELDPGPYEITVRQLFDPEVDLSAETGPSFEIVWALNAGTPAARVEQVAWWDG